jgi:alkylhydroperoxidase family enzyme
MSSNADAGHRVRLPLPPGDEHPIQLAGRYGPELVAALDEVHASAMLLDELDRDTTEFVRRYCAVWHDCRICQSLRLNGASKTVFEKEVIDYENGDLLEAHRVALRLADAFTSHPDRIDAELRSQVQEFFTEKQTIEILLDIISWSQQKALVALQLEVPAPDGTPFGWDENGHVLIG